MDLAWDAWIDVNVFTISNCFCKTAIISTCNHDGSLKGSEFDFTTGLLKNSDSEAKGVLAEDLQQLQDLNIAHQRNMISIAELLNPTGKHSSGLEEWALTEIFESIMDWGDSSTNTNQDAVFTSRTPWLRPTYTAFMHLIDVVSNFIKHKKSPSIQVFWIYNSLSY